MVNMDTNPFDGNLGFPTSAADLSPAAALLSFSQSEISSHADQHIQMNYMDDPPETTNSSISNDQSFLTASNAADYTCNVCHKVCRTQNALK